MRSLSQGGGDGAGGPGVPSLGPRRCSALRVRRGQAQGGFLRVPRVEQRVLKPGQSLETMQRSYPSALQQYLGSRFQPRVYSQNVSLHEAATGEKGAGFFSENMVNLGSPSMSYRHCEVCCGAMVEV